MVDSNIDVIVVGGGPVGMATALGLAHHGVSCTVIEPQTQASEGSKAFVMWGRTLEAFEAWGLTDALLARGDPRDTVAPVSTETGRPIFTVDFSGLAEHSAMPGVLFLSQSSTEVLLREAVESHPDVTWVHGEVVDVVQGADAVAVEVHGGGEGVPAKTMHARYVVGADGARSVVRSSQGGQLTGKPIRVEVLVVDVALEDGAGLDDEAALPPILLVRKHPGLLAALRFSPGRWRILESRTPIVPVSVTAADDLPPATPDRTVEELEVLAHEVFGPRALSVVWQSKTTLYQQRAQHFRLGQRVVLAGDSAHLVSPSGGQGMNQGIQDAENLAWSLAAAVAADKAGDAATVDAMLDGYAGERERVADVVARRARLNSRLEFATPPWLRPMAFAALRGALSITWFARHLARRLSMRDLRYTVRDSARLQAGSRLGRGSGLWFGARFSLGAVGRSVPNVVQPDGRRLFAAIEARVAVISVACDPPAVSDGVVAVRVERAPRGTRLRKGDVAVIRPDRHIGAALRRPTATGLRDALASAGGVQFPGPLAPPDRN